MFAVLLFTVTLIWGMRGRALVPTRMQSVAEISYEFVANMVRDNVGADGQRFFPLVFSLFMFVLVANLFGMFPYFFTVTSSIIVTFALAMLADFTALPAALWIFFRERPSPPAAAGETSPPGSRGSAPSRV